MAAAVMARGAETLIVSQKEQAAAEKVVNEVDGGRGTARVRLKVVVGDRETDLSDELTQLVLEALRCAGNGRTLTLGSMPKELTTTAAAKLLGVSRPTLMKWVGEGRLAFHKVGRHTRFKSEDVLRLKKQRRRAQIDSVRRMMELEDEMEDFS